MSNDVDPVILLRMSERDWLTVVSDLNNEQVNDILEHETYDAHNIDTQEQDTSFGDVENYERLIQTCDVNLDTLRNVKFSSDVTPKCLPTQTDVVTFSATLVQISQVFLSHLER